MVLTAAAIGLGLANIVSTRAQGKRQQKMQEEAMRQQEQAQAVARSAAASERQAQAAESKRMRQRRPDASKIMARARGQRMAGETFLTGPAGVQPLGSTRYVG
jgi:Flp pilus assembly protein TadB